MPRRLDGNIWVAKGDDDCCVPYDGTCDTCLVYLFPVFEWDYTLFMTKKLSAEVVSHQVVMGIREGLGGGWGALQEGLFRIKVFCACLLLSFYYPRQLRLATSVKADTLSLVL